MPCPREPAGATADVDGGAGDTAGEAGAGGAHRDGRRAGDGAAARRRASTGAAGSAAAGAAGTSTSPAAAARADRRTRARRRRAAAQRAATAAARRGRRPRRARRTADRLLRRHARGLHRLAQVSRTSPLARAPGTSRASRRWPRARRSAIDAPATTATRPTGAAAPSPICAPRAGTSARRRTRSWSRRARRLRRCPRAVRNNKPVFFVTRQRAGGLACDATTRTGANNLYGCGNIGSAADKSACAPFTRMLRDSDCQVEPAVGLRRRSRRHEPDELARRHEAGPRAAAAPLLQG